MISSSSSLHFQILELWPTQNGKCVIWQDNQIVDTLKGRTSSYQWFIPLDFDLVKDLSDIGMDELEVEIAARPETWGLRAQKNWGSIEGNSIL